MPGIERAEREYTDAEIAAVLEPEVREWFFGTFGGFTPPQRYAVVEVHEGKNVLVSSPTGSGKTLSAFLAAVNELVALGKRGELEDRVYCIYVSPLKALNNDVERNLRVPLDGISGVFEEAGAVAPVVRVGVRTGDTPQKDRAAQTRKPPHILITTPESLAIMLAAPKMGEHIARARWVIVDEIHALAESKRGVHLSLTLERLSSRAVRSGSAEPVRIGLSATISPLEEVAAFLVGDRDCLLVDVNYLKFTDLEVVSPVADLVNTPREVREDKLYALLDDLISTHRTTLVFTNTRSGTERLVLHLKQRFGRKYAELDQADALSSSRDPEFEEVEPATDVLDDEAPTTGRSFVAARSESEGKDEAPTTGRSFVAAHHGSLSKETRLEVEERLKRGDLKTVVCSTSLELGIDIGYVDLVVLLGSPKGISRALQRVGRSGHKLHETSKGRIVVLDRDDLVECTVLVKKAKERRLDAIRIPKESLDVLCQHLVGMAIEDAWGVDEAFDLVRRAYPYRGLAFEEFERCLRYLAGRYESLEERRVYGKIWLDDERRTFGKRGRLVRAIYSMNVGTIPDTTLAKVFEGERYVGQVEEDFVEQLDPGDVFVLGGSTWQFQYARGMKVHVGSARGKRPTVPSWYSEQLPLSTDLAREVRLFRDDLGRRLDDEDRESTLSFLRKGYHVDAVTAEAIYNYFSQQARFAGVPRADEVLVEEFVNDDLQRNYVFHTLHGRRTNEALARAFAKSLTRERGVNVRVQVSDNGFVLAVPRSTVLTATEVKGLFFMDLRAELERSLENSELLKRRFRHVATRALLILRNYAGRQQTVGRQQVNAFVLFHVLRKLDPDFPVVREAYREIFEEAFDVEAAEALAYSVLTRKTKVRFLRQRKAPSPFAFNLVAMGSQDAVVMEDKTQMIKDLHERVMELLAEGAK